MSDLPRIMQFILQNHEPARDWNPVKLFEWVAWAEGNGFVNGVFDDLGQLVGMAIAHPVMKAEDADDECDYEGPCLFIDLMIALRPGVLAACGLSLLKRFGHRSTVAWRRAPFNVVNEWPIKMVKRNLFRKELARKTI